MKKGDGMPFWIIITAIIALIVMVVLISIFSRKTTDITQELLSCSLKGGECSPIVCGENTQEIQNTNCGTGQFCCVGIKSG